MLVAHLQDHTLWVVVGLMAACTDYAGYSRLEADLRPALFPAASYKKLRLAHKHTHVMLQGCSSFLKHLASSVMSRDKTWRCVLLLVLEPSTRFVHIATGHTPLYIRLWKHLSAFMQNCLPKVSPHGLPIGLLTVSSTQ